MADYIKIYTFDHSGGLPKLQMAVPPKTGKSVIKEMFLMAILRNLMRRGLRWEDVTVNRKNVMKFVTGVRMQVGKVYAEDFFGRIGE